MPVSLTDAWDASYARGENHLFWPHEEIVRFAAMRVRRRRVDGWDDRLPFIPPPRALDLGCGIGRHVAFLDQLGCEAWGIDHSATAVAQGRRWLEGSGQARLAPRLVQGDATAMPWPDGHFAVIVSHGVLDSMPLATAEAAFADAARVLAPGGLMYADVVSGDDGTHGREFAGEVTVPTGHEAGTIQLYFNWALVERCLGGRFEVLDAVHVLRARALATGAAARWHLHLRRRG
jgi:SAM-dependent methyltransferase